MDMEMDMPAPEELEWLESEAFFPEADLDDEEGGFFIPEVEAIPVSKSVSSDADPASEPMPSLHEFSDAPSPPVSDDPSAAKKRHWLEEIGDLGALEDPVVRGEERRSKRRAFEGGGGEEDARVPPLPAEKIISRFAWEIEGLCIPVTDPSGDRVYAKVGSRGEVDGLRRASMRENPANALLTEPIGDLIEKVEQEALSKILENTFGSPSNVAEPISQAVNEQLWVEKYAPKSFMELLSDEQTNREVLLWLKQWDSCVFGSQIRTTMDDVLNALRRHSSVSKHQYRSENRNFHGNKNFLSNKHLLNGSGRVSETENSRKTFEMQIKKSSTNQLPEQKVLLLCGPPGLGKTTLAHVVARHCGYRVVEINASDDRSSSVIESKILDVVQMNSVSADSRPKCLVIDEIDGALGEGKGAVEVILKMVTSDKKVNATSGGQDTEAGKPSSKNTRRKATLSRPIICICNDLYAPALRPLRQVAKVHIFMQPTVNRVVNRLKYICEREGFRTSSIALTALAEYAECDIRSCLNTLQFLNKKKESLNILEFASQVVCRKDFSRSVFDVWKQVFQKKKVKRESKLMGSCNRHQNIDFLYNLISNTGEYELTMDGIHENLLQLSYHDPLMKKTVNCLNVIGLSDSVLQYVMRTQQMSLQAYQPIIMINMRYLISQAERPNIVWPKSFQRCRTVATERKDLLKGWKNKISPYISRHLSAESFIEDTVSPFLHILAPPSLRPVALNLLSDKEKNDLGQLVDTMVSYSVTYKVSKPEPLDKTFKYGPPSDAPVLTLNPPINDFVNFKDYQSHRAELSSTMRQVLVHEVEKQRIILENNKENHVSPILGASATTIPIERSSKPLSASASVPRPVPAPSNSFTTVGRKSTPAMGNNKRVSTTTNFFDRFRKKTNTEPRSGAEDSPKRSANARDSHALLFKYNEGFTNAVKRPVKMRDLLLV